MAINRTEPDLWNEDTRKSVEMYNEWFLSFAPTTYANERKRATRYVAEVLKETDYLRLTNRQIRENPKIVSTLRMATSPPLAKARLVGFSGIKPSLLDKLEEGDLPERMTESELEDNLSKIVHVIDKLLDRELFSWLGKNDAPGTRELRIAECVLADRVCRTNSDPVIRNEQEKRQLRKISDFLISLGYRQLESKHDVPWNEMPVGTFTFHKNVPVSIRLLDVNIPVDVAIKRKNAPASSLPLLVECKSAGDYTNTNKRRKEESQKIMQLRDSYGQEVEFVLFLCGYFDSTYLGYEAAGGIDWVWEHRIEDFRKAGV